jgi:hypothetical protein
MAGEKSFRERTVRVHITQDDWGYWMMTLERDDGALCALSYGFEDESHPVDDARHPERLGLPAGAEIWISQPSVPRKRNDPTWTKPAPRAARAPYHVFQHGKRVS